MESEDQRLKHFFDELYLSTNPSTTKNKDTMGKYQSNWYFYVILLVVLEMNSLTMQKRSKNVFRFCWNTQFNNRHFGNIRPDNISLDFLPQWRRIRKTSDNCGINAIILNIDDYHSIHTKRMPRHRPQHILLLSCLIRSRINRRYRNIPTFNYGYSLYSLTIPLSTVTVVIHASSSLIYHSPSQHSITATHSALGKRNSIKYDG